MTLCDHSDPGIQNHSIGMGEKKTTDMEEERKKYLFRFSVVILLCGISFSFCLASLACN